MEKVVRYTKFAHNPHGDGGSKRSAQIEEYWREQKCEFVDEKFSLPKNYTIWQAVKWVCRAVIFISQHVGWRLYPSIKEKYRAILTYALRLPVIYDKYKGQNVTFLWEDTHDMAALYMMKETGAKIIAYPHNLESLVPTQKDPVTRKQSPYWLYEEVERLKQCDEVYAISKEETWLLQLFGVSAKYYPYYPPKLVEKELLEIKNQREKKDKHNKQFLMLGSATNPPTRMGMQNLIDYFERQKDKNYTIHIAGYNTECLATSPKSTIVNHGTVSSKALNDLLINTDGIIINQPTTSGALTRIVENRIAGIPIYANFGAARDFYNLPDIHVYESFDELEKFLQNE